MRYRLQIEYDGTLFRGWQRQRNAPSVQAALEAAVKNFSGEDIVVFGASRTDAGVHALGQVAHFDLCKPYPPHTIFSAINHFVRPHIAVLSAVETHPKFHARFDVLQKRYIYKIANQHAPLALMRSRAWRIQDEIDIHNMREASKILIGYHDFTTFRSTACQSQSPCKNLDNIEISQRNNIIELTFRAKSFMHNQVRIMTSALKDVGIGKLSAAQLQTMLEAKNRSAGPETAPPEGLYLAEISYSNHSYK